MPSPARRDASIQEANHNRRAGTRALAWLVTLAALVVVALVLVAVARSSSTDDNDPGPDVAPEPSVAAPSTAPAPAPTPAVTDPPTASDEAAELLRQVRVAEELDDSDYDRGRFAPWLDDDGDGCDTRCEVLAAERLDDLPGLPGGGWRSVYDGLTTDDPSELDIDHVVALREAWRSGAATWDPLRRAAFSNDLDDPRTLIAVSASSNRSKGDRDPSEWRPPDEGHWCGYVTDWLAVKLRWDLAVDPIEFTAVQFLVDDCA